MGRRRRRGRDGAPDIERWRRELQDDLPGAPGDPRVDREAFNALVLENLDDWGGVWSPHAWERVEPTLEAMAGLARARDFRLLVLAFPVRQQVEAEFVADEPQRRLRQITDDLGLPLLDLLPVLRRAQRRDPEPLFADHCHHTAHGNRLIAEQVLSFLLEAGAGRR